MMRTCRHCDEKFDPASDPVAQCRILRDGEVLSPCEPLPRGFASLPRERVSEIAKKGGVSAHAAGTAHRFTSEEATAAGKRGGNAPHVRRGPVKKVG
jgi:general stress protein YciG